MQIYSNHILSLLILVLTAAVGISCQNTNSDNAQKQTENTGENPARIITLSGFLTELVYALDAGDQVVGVDATSTYPAEVNQMNKLGHITQLNAEGILSLNPDIVFVQEDQLRQSEALTQLQNSSIKIIPVP